VYGLAVGGCNALVAIGFSLIFGVARLLNMAHGMFFVLGGYISYIFVASVFGFLPPEIAMALSCIVAAILMFFVGIGAYAMLHPLGTNILATIITSSAQAYIIGTILLIIFGAYVKSLPFLISGTINIAGVEVANQYLLQTVISILLMAILIVFLSKTKIGKAIRATADDREAAMLMGINISKVNALVYGISAALAAVAAAMTCSIPFNLEPLYAPGIWMGRAFIMAILGGLGSISGTVLGAFIYSYVQMGFMEISPAWFPGFGSYLVDIVMPIMVLMILYFRPTGIRGRPIREILWEGA
jgi:branched-chain amino acid transport system permease protein